jgi:hypothetical protein
MITSGATLRQPRAANGEGEKQPIKRIFRAEYTLEGDDFRIG